MEISIDTRFIKGLTFQDEKLLEEMLHEWISDARSKSDEIVKRIGEGDVRRIFNSLHELKTNFTMLHCGKAIRESDALLHKLEKGALITNEEFKPVLDMINAIVKLIEKK
ncbi:MAG: hypothetical protein IPM34_00405 [Saprospiraceae bacterium]|nr:hypothetical protein [Saprospiraceae bacterium]